MLLAGFSCPSAIWVTDMSLGRASLCPQTQQGLGRDRAALAKGDRWQQVQAILG